jgi:hypothetical protein
MESQNIMKKDLGGIKIILVEDDGKKIRDIKDYFLIKYNYTDLMVRESYQSGLRELLLNNYDLLLLDMSIPTWDKSPSEPGGNFEKFGGLKILREMDRKHKIIDTILVTMFDDFGESDESITLKQIDGALHREFENNYLGAVFYNSKENKWKDEISIFISRKFNL